MVIWLLFVLAAGDVWSQWDIFDSKLMRGTIAKSELTPILRATLKNADYDPTIIDSYEKFLPDLLYKEDLEMIMTSGELYEFAEIRQKEIYKAFLKELKI